LLFAYLLSIYLSRPPLSTFCDMPVCPVFYEVPCPRTVGRGHNASGV